MHPLIIVAPIVALLLAPQFFVRRILKQHNRNVNELRHSGAEVARELLDLHQLGNIKVESTDLGDHYDPKTKTIRLSRDKFERRSLTAVTTAAHEVGHALQDAGGR